MGFYVNLLFSLNNSYRFFCLVWFGFCQSSRVDRSKQTWQESSVDRIMVLKKKKKKLTSHFHSLDLEKKGRQLVPVQSATLSLATEGKVMTKDWQELSRTLADVRCQDKSWQEGWERKSPDTSKVFGGTNNICDYDVTCPDHTPLPVMDSGFPHRSGKLLSISRPPAMCHRPLGLSKTIMAQ